MVWLSPAHVINIANFLFWEKKSHQTGSNISIVRSLSLNNDCKCMGFFFHWIKHIWMEADNFSFPALLSSFQAQQNLSQPHLSASYVISFESSHKSFNWSIFLPLIFQDVQTYCSCNRTYIWMPDLCHKIHLEAK